MQDLKTPGDLFNEKNRLEADISVLHDTEMNASTATLLSHKSTLLSTTSSVIDLYQTLESTFNVMAEKYERKDAKTLHANKMVRDDYETMETALKDFNSALSTLNVLRRKLER